MVVVPLRVSTEPAESGTAPDGRSGTVNPDTGGLLVFNDDGSMDELDERDWRPARRAGSIKHYDNLVDVLDSNEVARLGDEVWRGVTADIQSRRDYMEMTAEAIRMLGLRLDPPRSDAGGSGAPLEGMSTVRHPLLLEACLGFQSDFRGEMLPAAGPVKVRNDSTDATISSAIAKYVIDLLVQAGAIPPEGADQALALTQRRDNTEPAPVTDSDRLAEDLEKDFNHFLTSTATEYYPDTDRAAFITGLMGCTFKKVYNCPLRERPVSESVSAKDLIVDAGVTDLRNAPRVTHEITMLTYEVLQLQDAGVYARGSLGQPLHMPDPVEQAASDALGISQSTSRPEDRPHVIWECYLRANVRGLDDKDDDAETRVPRSYKVSMDRDTRKVYEVRRNWRPADKRRTPRIVFVKYPFVPALGFYDIGLMHILGNTTMALTAAWRLNLDAMMFSNFPGFLYVDVLGKQLTNIFRVPPGGGVPIQTGGRPIGEMISKLPYQGPQAAGLSLVDNIAQTAGRVGNKPQIPTGEGQSNVPVGTVLATIVEATKLVGAVFKRLHGAQAEEFGLLKERFRDDPAAFWRHNPKPARKWEEAEFLAALDDCDLVPAADPNTPSQLHRIMQRLAVFQFAQAAPMLFKMRETAEWLLTGIGVNDPEALLNTPEAIAAIQAAQAQAGRPAAKAPPSQVAEQAGLMKAQAAQTTAEAKATATQADVELTQAQAAKTHAETATAGQDQQLRAAEAVQESSDRAADRQAQQQIDITREETERLKLQQAAAHHVDDHALGAAGLAVRPQPLPQGP